MITMKSAIKTALTSDTTLTEKLGGSRVYAVKAPKANEYPRITFLKSQTLTPTMLTMRPIHPGCFTR